MSAFHPLRTWTAHMLIRPKRNRESGKLTAERHLPLGYKVASVLAGAIVLFTLLERSGQIVIQEGKLGEPWFTLLLGTGFALMWVSILIGVVNVIVVIRRPSAWRVSLPAFFLLIAIACMFAEGEIPAPWSYWLPGLSLLAFAVSSIAGGWWRRECR